MTRRVLEDEIRFSVDDLLRFSAASYDRNPQHMSEEFARTSPYGERLVFGILGAVAGLGYLAKRQDQVLSTIELEFSGPLLLDLPYSLELDESRDSASVTLADGDRRLLSLRAGFRAGKLPQLSPKAPMGREGKTLLRQEAGTPDAAELRSKPSVTGLYAPDWRLVREYLEEGDLQEKGIGWSHLAVLFYASYLVGMELPGREALFSELRFEFDELPAEGVQPLSHTSTAKVFDERFGLLRVGVECRIASVPTAAGELLAFVREPTPSPYPEVTHPRADTGEELAGKVALVVGASRGLGAAISYLLASRGCTVVANYHRSGAEARALAETASSLPGRIEPLSGDASSPDVCRGLLEKIENNHRRLDILVCNAAPPPYLLSLRASNTARFLSYVSSSLALVASPLCAFLPLLARNEGWCVIISSAAVGAPPAYWTPYVSAKLAIEGLAEGAAVEYPSVGFLLVRPPKILTAMTNTPGRRLGAASPMAVAAKILDRVLGPLPEGAPEALEPGADVGN